MKEHKFILSALISLMLCFSFGIDAYSQANIKVPTEVRTETKEPTKKSVVKKPVAKNPKVRTSSSCRSSSTSRGMSAEEKNIIRNLVSNVVYVSGGTFMMGATSEQGSDAKDDEKPAHSVTLSSYYIGKYEVTQEEWTAIMGDNPSYIKGIRHPVEMVSWNDCQKFISRLNAKTGRNFRLPTEAEWEFAARGGNSSQGYKYSGSNFIDNVAWYGDNSGNSTHEVGTKASNELGLYDMSGNVYEWCSDWYGPYSSSSTTNPTGPYSGSNRVWRGGSFGSGWGTSSNYCRVTIRGKGSPDFPNGLDVGFRLALSK
jgi:formylglycine-generating enzyme required for sulfatase activity